MKKNAVALISGGLDSILAAKVVMEQGYEVTGLYCTSAFSKSYGNEQRTHAASVSRAVGIDLKIIDLGQPYIELIRSPKHGYGKNINPCIDCKIFMLEKAKNIMQNMDAPFVVTGEVLGQRPMSQRRDTLNVIERDSGLKGMILRPLSAALLPPTIAEQKGLIDRGKLLSISGRGRTVQLKLAEKYGITGFSAPAGGCLLTDKNFSDKLRDLFLESEKVGPADIRLLTVGRHFKLGGGGRIVVGRNNRENAILAELVREGLHLFLPHGFPGPAAVLSGVPTQENKRIVGQLIINYSKRMSNLPRLIRTTNDIFDPGSPMPIEALGINRIGAI